MDLTNILEIQAFTARDGYNDDFHVFAVRIIFAGECLQFKEIVGGNRGVACNHGIPRRTEGLVRKLCLMLALGKHRNRVNTRDGLTAEKRRIRARGAIPRKAELF